VAAVPHWNWARRGESAPSYEVTYGC